MCVDEAGLCDYELFNVSVAPFTASINGNTTFIGLPNNDSSNLLQRMYYTKGVVKTCYDANDVYAMRKMVDKEFAENYKKHLDGVLLAHGRRSSFVQWNYFINFTDSNGKFMTRDILENNNILVNEITMPINNDNDKQSYVIGGLDISPKKDFRVLTIGKSYIDLQGDIRSDVMDIKTYNKDKGRMEHELVAEQVALDCKMFKIDLLCVDSTSHQAYFIQTLRKKIKEVGINTLIVPFYYNQSTKPKLFGYLETCLFEGKLKLLKENCSWESKKLVEEMLYMIKEKGKKDSERITYYAPEGGDFSDDHMNSLALFNICLFDTIERFRKGDIAEDGAKRWRIRLNKFKELKDIEQNVQRNMIQSFYDVPI